MGLPGGSSSGSGGRSGGIYNSVKFKLARSSAAASSSTIGTECYPSLDKVREALKHAGLEVCYLIIGIHFTENNHGTGDPYEKAISIIEKTLEPFDADNLYHCFGFGDGKAEEAFSFRNDHSPCKGIKEVLACYNNIVPNVTLSGPTSFAAVINAAVDIVDKSFGQFHTLVLVADNQVTKSFFNPKSQRLSPEGIKTAESIINASSYPLSIILVGVGYGSCEHMKEFQNIIPKRRFNNFQFINFTDIENCMSDATPSMKEAAFAFAALKETPKQYKAALQLELIGNITGKAREVVPRSPPVPHTHHAPATSEQSNLLEPVSDERCRREVTDALWKGLESFNFIVGIDFTKSNEWTGNMRFNIQNLHASGDTPNPYERVISLLGKTFASPFQKDDFIHCFGFGDVTTVDHEVFSFHGDYSPCYGFDEVLCCYKRIVRMVELAGRASYAPVIEAAVDIVERSGGQYHVLVIIAAGQVTKSTHTSKMELSPQEDETIRSIADASSYPLFIIVVGVGDGPWEDMKKFEDKIPVRGNFQFVNFTEIMSLHSTTSEKQAAFALAARAEVPIHYMTAVERGLLGTAAQSAWTVQRTWPSAADT
ncbi:E3 ubiquitin-protein ligase RGLG4 isoform X2 [Rosa chinensis]|uniref:E3 ubiquitin-protein ligase RGLG4 isoform X2 n=1 Tax=Rosa chinensis TaxID=74649 RepID=UPI000D092B1A|nr:E3 ubiquitin-protein ligase RGLG4 isoform X2 [Rosa chinensis]